MSDEIEELQEIIGEANITQVSLLQPEVTVKPKVTGDHCRARRN